VNPELRETLTEALVKIEDLQRKVMLSVDKPEEGNTRSACNEMIAFGMGKLGEYVADVELMALEEADELAMIRENRKIGLMREIDPDTEKRYTATKAESLTELSPQVRSQLARVRALNHSHKVLVNKSKSVWAWLDSSRSRLSWLGREVIHGS
jgi:hypothetical protein